jgi:hypothetical protein
VVLKRNNGNEYLDVVPESVCMDRSWAKQEGDTFSSRIDSSARIKSVYSALVAPESGRYKPNE